MPSGKRAKTLSLSKSRKSASKSQKRARSLSLRRSSKRKSSKKSQKSKKSEKFDLVAFTKKVNDVFKHCNGECKKSYARAAVHSKPNLKDLDMLVLLARTLQAEAEAAYFLSPISSFELRQQKLDREQQFRELIGNSIQRGNRCKAFKAPLYF